MRRNLIETILGAEEKMIPPGGEIRFTQSPLSLDDPIGQLIFSNTETEKEGGKN